MPFWDRQDVRGPLGEFLCRGVRPRAGESGVQLPALLGGRTRGQRGSCPRAPYPAAGTLLPLSHPPLPAEKSTKQANLPNKRLFALADGWKGIHRLTMLHLVDYLQQLQSVLQWGFGKELPVLPFLMGRVQ